LQKSPIKETILRMGFYFLIRDWTFCQIQSCICVCSSYVFMYKNNVLICTHNLSCSDHVDSCFLAEAVEYLSLFFTCICLHIYTLRTYIYTRNNHMDSCLLAEMVEYLSLFFIYIYIYAHYVHIYTHAATIWARVF